MKTRLSVSSKAVVEVKVRPELERELVQRLLWNSVSPFAVSGGKRIQYNKRDLEIALMSAI